MGYRLVHLGFPKSGSTTLQKVIFPKICQKYNCEYIVPAKFYEKFKYKNEKNKTKYHSYENVPFKKLPENFILSSEGLILNNYEFSDFEKTFEVNKKFFDKECHILIIIRKPSDYLNSLYIQQIQELNMVKEDNFFINKKPDENLFFDRMKHNLYGFDYNKLIELYKSYYPKISIVKYELFDSLDFLDKIFNFDKEFKESLLKSTKKKRLNKSLSKSAINLCFFLNNFFSLKKLDNNIGRLYSKKDNFYGKIFNKFLNQIRVRSLLQNRFDKFNPFYSKYKINLKKIPFDIDKLDESYENIKV